MAISPSTRVGRRKFMDRSTLGARSCARMSSLVFPAALLLLLAAPAAAPAGPPGGIAWQQVTIHERIVVRVPRMPIPPGRQPIADIQPLRWRSEEHTSELQSLMRISYAVFCLKKKKRQAVNKNG